MEELINIYRLLSDQTRLRIILLLAQKELCVCELSAILEVPQPKISKNLGRLRDLNLVSTERKEKFVFYKLKTDNAFLNCSIQNILDNLDKYEQLVIDRNRNIDNKNVLKHCCNTKLV
jgi:ArsR family transcriptional regulator